MDKVEIEVTPGELARIREHKREIEKRFRDIEGLERTLRILKYRILKEREERLKKKLEEMKAHYEELLEFEVKAKEDREFFMHLRKELSDENRRLRERLGG
ncbi:hypothetical protein [Thermococcus sp.]